MAKVLGFAVAVLATVGVTYAFTFAAFSLAPVANMPPARPIYESRDALLRLHSPCEHPYAHRSGAGSKWVQGCAK